MTGKLIVFEGGEWVLVDMNPRALSLLLEILEQRYPYFQGLLLNDNHTDKGRDAIVLVCGRHIEHLDGVRTPLSEQDYVAVTPLVAGG